MPGAVWDRRAVVSHATIQLAVNTAATGDEVVICPGTYTENVNVASKTGLTIRSSTGVPSDVAVFPSNSTNPTFRFVNSQNITLRDMSIHNHLLETVIDVSSGNSGDFTFQKLRINTVPNGNGTRGIFIDNNSVRGEFIDIEIDKVQNGIVINHLPPGDSSIQHYFNTVIVKASDKGIQVSDKALMSQVTTVTTGTGIDCSPACLAFNISNSTIYSSYGKGIHIDQNQATAYLVSIKHTIIKTKDEGFCLFRNQNSTKPNWYIEYSRITSYTKQAIVAQTNRNYFLLCRRNTEFGFSISRVARPNVDCS